MKLNILVVEDNAVLNKNICFALRKEGYWVQPALSLQQALAEFSNYSIDLVILDVMLKDDNGIQLIPKFKKADHVKVIMLTAVSGKESKVSSYEYGADDYITKPFDMYELIFKLSLLKKYIIREKKIVLFGDILIDKEKMIIKSEDGLSSNLSPFEMSVFIKLLYKYLDNKILVKEDIFGLPINDSEEKRVRTLIGRLRKHLITIQSENVFIETLRGVGYRLVLLGDNK